MWVDVTFVAASAADDDDVSLAVTPAYGGRSLHAASFIRGDTRQLASYPVRAGLTRRVRTWTCTIHE